MKMENNPKTRKQNLADDDIKWRKENGIPLDGNSEWHSHEVTVENLDTFFASAFNGDGDEKRKP